MLDTPTAATRGWATSDPASTPCRVPRPNVAYEVRWTDRQSSGGSRSLTSEVSSTAAVSQAATTPRASDRRLRPGTEATPGTRRSPRRNWTK